MTPKKSKLDPIVATDPFLGVSTTKSGKNVDKYGKTDPQITPLELWKAVGGRTDLQGGNMEIPWMKGIGWAPRPTSALRLSEGGEEIRGFHGSREGAVPGSFSIGAGKPGHAYGRGAPYIAEKRSLAKGYAGDGGIAEVSTRLKNPLRLDEKLPTDQLNRLADSFAARASYKMKWGKDSPQYLKIRQEAYDKLQSASLASVGRSNEYSLYAKMRRLARDYLLPHPHRNTLYNPLDAKISAWKNAESAEERMVRTWIRHAGFDGIIGGHEPLFHAQDVVQRQIVPFTGAQTKLIASNAPRIAHETYGGHH